MVAAQGVEPLIGRLSTGCSAVELQEHGGEMWCRPTPPKGLILQTNCQSRWPYISIVPAISLGDVLQHRVLVAQKNGRVALREPYLRIYLLAALGAIIR